MKKNMMTSQRTNIEAYKQIVSEMVKDRLSRNERSKKIVKDELNVVTKGKTIEIKDSNKE